MSEFTLDQFRERVRGEIITPDDIGHEKARHVDNAMIDRRPALVVRAADAGDVLAAVAPGRTGRVLRPYHVMGRPARSPEGRPISARAASSYVLATDGTGARWCRLVSRRREP
jgi:hypothetical protein